MTRWGHYSSRPPQKLAGSLSPMSCCVLPGCLVTSMEFQWRHWCSTASMSGSIRGASAIHRRVFEKHGPAKREGLAAASAHTSGGSTCFQTSAMGAGTTSLTLMVTFASGGSAVGSILFVPSPGQTACPCGRGGRVAAIPASPGHNRGARRRAARRCLDSSEKCIS